MSRVTVTVLRSDTEREVWTFGVLQYPTAYLDSYVHETRPSTRHRKWAAIRSWHRLHIDRGASVGDRMKSEPEVPAVVLDDALEALRAQIHIRRWSDRGQG
jgi:hypothetical protein